MLGLRRRFVLGEDLREGLSRFLTERHNKTAACYLDHHFHMACNCTVLYVQPYGLESSTKTGTCKVQHSDTM
jgi:hypothetical protein